MSKPVWKEEKKKGVEICNVEGSLKGGKQKKKKSMSKPVWKEEKKGLKYVT